MHQAWLHDADRRAPGRHAAGAPSAAPGLGGGRCRLRGADRSRRLPGHPRRADHSAAGRVRLVARHHLAGRLDQPAALRPDRAVRRGIDEPLRHPARRVVCTGPGGPWQRADRLHDGELAARPALGRARRARHRFDGTGLRRDHHRTLVREAPRPGDRCPHRWRSHGPASLPACSSRGSPSTMAGGQRPSSSRAARSPSYPSCCSSCASTRPTSGCRSMAQPR